MDWIAEVDRLDKLLHSEGIPDANRMRMIAQVADVFAQADKARRVAEREAQAAALLHMGAAAIAERQGCHRATVYRRAERARVRQKG